MYPKSTIAIALLVLPCAHAMAQSSAQKSPWRRDDVTLVSLCFDGLDRGTAPPRLNALEFTDISASTASFELIGFTTTDRPQYQASLTHPTQFRAVLVELPGTPVATLIEPPLDLEPFIEGWRHVPSPSQCTGSLSKPTFKRTPAFVLDNSIKCPDLGVKVSFRVDNGSAYSLRRVLERQRGLSVLNGLRGCTELIYDIRSSGKSKAKSAWPASAPASSIEP